MLYDEFETTLSPLAEEDDLDLGDEITDEEDDDEDDEPEVGDVDEE